MQPCEAYTIISRCLDELARLRETVYIRGKGYSQQEVEAQVICFEALRRMQEEDQAAPDKRK